MSTPLYIETLATDALAGLCVRDLEVRYTGFMLGPVSFQAAPGERIALVGPNGAGKSTTMRVVAGRQHEFRGSVTLGNIELRSAGAPWRERIGFLPETLLGFGWMTVQEHLAFLQNFFPGWDSAYARQLCERLQLSSSAKVGTLSKGMRVKLAFVAAEAFRPPILLLDEPTSGLDPVVRGDLIATLQEIAQSDAQRIILFSTHILEDVEAVAERVLLLSDGQLTHDVHVADLRAQDPGVPLSRKLYELLTDESATFRRAPES